MYNKHRVVSLFWGPPPRSVRFPVVVADFYVGVQGILVGRHEGAVEAHPILYHFEQILPPVEGVLPHFQIDLSGGRGSYPLYSGVSSRNGLKRKLEMSTYM